MLAATYRKLQAILYRQPVLILIFLFLVSVAVRLPNLDRPLSKHHEANAALVLINAETWNLDGPAAYGYLPANAYHYPGDDLNDTANLAKGYIINTSFGTLWYSMPYYFFKVLGVAPSPLSLQVFNLLLHFITTVLVYYLALLLFSVHPKKHVAAFFTTAFYVFAPGPLWFHGNGYVHEIAVLPFVFGAVLLYMRSNYQSNWNWWRLLLLAIFIIAGIQCDWLMCFVALSLFIAEVVKFIKYKQARSLTVAMVIALSVVAGLIIIIIQFSSFMGFENYMKAMLDRYVQRGVAGTSERGGLAANAGILSWYVISYGFLLMLLPLFFLRKEAKQFVEKNKTLKYFLLIAAAICLAHHLLFWGFTSVHDYAVTKSAFLIAIVGAMAILQVKRKQWQAAILMLVLIGSIALYYYFNRPGAYAANGQPYSYFKDLGEAIKNVETSDEYVFTNVPELSANLVYYSKRYYKVVDNYEKAVEYFETLPGTKAVYIETADFRFVSYKRMRK
ncbi:hypothetical protein [Aridibaculum aurantiacum]|uniref:hypothetical protein n=1 Tax=Aridibaculum aurantiacum TaxID=2810307 RepID=UPI001A9644C8|nr:hypothetical protein [Aridibaculum aurantiacum]